ncbi:putative phage tail assembly chaperone [Pseudomonas sp. LB3P31]
MTEKREITLEVGDKEFTFSVTPQDVTKYFNAMTANNKVSPSHNLLINTGLHAERDELRKVLLNPVMTMQISSALLEEYAPDIEVIVKKPSSTLSA